MLLSPVFWFGLHDARTWHNGKLDSQKRRRQRTAGIGCRSLPGHCLSIPGAFFPLGKSHSRAFACLVMSRSSGGPRQSQKPRRLPWMPALRRRLGTCVQSSGGQSLAAWTSCIPTGEGGRPSPTQGLFSDLLHEDDCVFFGLM